MPAPGRRKGRRGGGGGVGAGSTWNKGPVLPAALRKALVEGEEAGEGTAGSNKTSASSGQHSRKQKRLLAKQLKVQKRQQHQTALRARSNKPQPLQATQPQGAKAKPKQQKQLTHPSSTNGTAKAKPAAQKNSKLSTKRPRPNPKHLSAEDAELKRLAKKLKIKSGKLTGPDDGLQALLGGLAGPDLSAEELSGREGGLSDDDEESGEDGDLDSEAGLFDDRDELHGDEDDDVGHEVDEDEDDGNEEEEETEANAKGSPPKGAKGAYVPPHLRQSQVDTSEAALRLQRRVRGLLNRLTEANIESIMKESVSLYMTMTRHNVTLAVTSEIISTCASGNRGNDQHAATFAAFMGAVSAVSGSDVGAQFAAALAVRLEEAVADDDSLASRNLAIAAAHLYVFGVLEAVAIFSLLQMLCQRFTEQDVSTIVVLLQSCGMQLRAEDPAAMKEFIVAVHARAADRPQGEGAISKRVQFMLDMIVDIKNNKGVAARKKEAAAVGAGAQQAKLKKWVKGLGVSEVTLRSVTWQKLLEPNKKGRWWLPAAAGEELDNFAGRPLVEDNQEGAELLQLAAQQRMSTSARRAVFCAIMAAEDYLDAHARIQGLSLPGAQAREVPRVLVECCLQEAAFNPYYAALATHLCQLDHNHKVTFQYCFWDHFKQLSGMELRRAANLGRLIAHMVGSFAISLAVLKTQDLVDTVSMSPRGVLCFRVVFEHLLTDYDDETVRGVFGRVAGQPTLAPLRDGVSVFIIQHVLIPRVLQGLSSEQAAEMKRRWKLGKKAMTDITSFGL
eukprot:jgi/Chlat1/2011/Chrsp158S02301